MDFILLNEYTDAASRAMGGRFLHARTGFLVDLLEIQSVPQGFFWVKTLARTERGEAHACEHLLLGKGAKGRAVAALEEMTLSASSAWTGQLSTAYHFNTLAGEEGFLRNLEARLDALLHPDFSDEEIRREVAHVAVAQDPVTGRLSLAEKGTVFTEMMSSSEGPSYPLWTGISELLYGTGHVQAHNAGGRPEAMRALTAADLRAFHAEFYHPAGMGLIASLPAALPAERVLVHLDAVLARLWPGGDHSEAPGIQTHQLPPPAPTAAPGALEIRPYASESAASPGQAVFAWPARLDLDPDEIALAELFLDSIAGGPGTPLYAAFIASRTRVLKTGASAVFGYHSDEPGHPLMIGLAGLDPDALDRERLAAIRRTILAALRAAHAWQDGDPALAAFNREAASRLAAQRKEARQALDRPPMFGWRRGHADYWHSVLGLLERQPGARKSLVLEDRYRTLAASLAEGRNLWRGAIERWGLLEAPVGLGVRPDPALPAATAAAQAARLAGFAAALGGRYGGPGKDEQLALAAYGREVEAAGAALAVSAGAEPIPDFVKAPPLGLDEDLAVETIALRGGVPLVVARFEHLSTATLGLACRLDVVPEAQLHLLPLLPNLLTRAGLALDGTLLDTEAMQARLRHELTGYSAYFDTNPRSGRIELVLKAAAAGPAERARLLPWLDAALRHGYLAPDNLPRLRDLAAQAFSRLRTRMQAAEEAWVVEPAAAYRYQTNPLYLSVACFLTELHHAFRLQWLLADPGDAQDQAALASFLDALAQAAASGRRALAARCMRPPALAPSASPAAALLADEIHGSLGALLPELPEGSLAVDWQALCATLRADLFSPPATTLSALAALLAALAHADNWRAFLIASSDDSAALLPALNAWAATLDDSPSRRVCHGKTPRILSRLQERRTGAKPPVYVGLLDANTRSGTLLFSACAGEPWSAERERLLDALAGNLFGGGGGHGLFMRTWAAGLAYSNGYRYRPRSGLASYFAERCPDVAETLRFAASVIREGQVDEALLPYALAVAFNESRAAGSFEQRGEAMAADLADGLGPERVRACRRGLLALRDEPDLAAALAARLRRVYGQVLIGLDRPLAESAEGVFFLIGPEVQFVALEALIAAEEAPTVVERLAPRDFWLVSSPPASDS